MQMQGWRHQLGENIRRIRLAKGLTQEALAADAGLDLTYLGGIERGRRNPTVDVLLRLAKVLGCELPELLVGLSP